MKNQNSGFLYGKINKLQKSLNYSIKFIVLLLTVQIFIIFLAGLFFYYNF